MVSSYCSCAAFSLATANQVRLNPPQGGAKVNPPTLELPAGLAPQASATLYASLEMPPGATSAKCDVRTSLGLYPVLCNTLSPFVCVRACYF